MITEFDDYQQRARSTAIYPHVGDNLWYPALGLGGEAGEVQEIIKKAYRDSDGKLTLDQLAKLKKELGDELWYIANICCEVGFTLSEVAETNIRKLAGRVERNTVHGSGDER